ncbi:TRAM domain-containing protein [Candidatus Saccharibacteria bacterium]|nr:TRAM domain-containing protein [Candidatus Saccharibacteria bacterium]
MEYLILFICIIIFCETTFLVIKKRRPLNNNRHRIIYIDTSALIDGRILEIAKTGFIDGDFIILKSVLRELQLLADGKDSEKRKRARAGLEIASELERVININTEIVDDGEEYKYVDDELLKFAKLNKGTILTLDYNLIKVAKAEKIEILNINDLALAVRLDFLPGEKIKIKITEKGANKGQGVGHLQNGTMVVVDKAANKIGKELMVEFVRTHETSSGKIIFAKIAKD